MLNIVNAVKKKIKNVQRDILELLMINNIQEKVTVNVFGHTTFESFMDTSQVTLYNTLKRKDGNIFTNSLSSNHLGIMVT